MKNIDSGKLEYITRNMSLYTPENMLAENSVDFWYKLLGGNQSYQFDSFCPKCNKNSTFKTPINRTLRGTTSPGFSPGNDSARISSIRDSQVLTFECQRKNSHSFDMIFYIDTDSSDIIKIGQYPSLADIQFPEIEKYKKILETDYIEFRKAIGLFASGIGVGSFVYLRRIFENLIYDTHKKSNLNIDNFKSLRMNEKITELKEHLPKAVSEIPQLYGIMSKGIHELHEDECKEIFPLLKIAIEMILDDKLAQKNKETKLKKLKKAISDTASKLS